MASMASDHFGIHFCLAFHWRCQEASIFGLFNLGLVSSKAAQVKKNLCVPGLCLLSKRGSEQPGLNQLRFTASFLCVHDIPPSCSENPDVQSSEADQI